MNENYVTLTIGKQKNIALIAHDNKKAGNVLHRQKVRK